MTHDQRAIRRHFEPTLQEGIKALGAERIVSGEARVEPVLRDARGFAAAKRCETSDHNALEPGIGRPEEVTDRTDRNGRSGTDLSSDASDDIGYDRERMDVLVSIDEIGQLTDDGREAFDLAGEVQTYGHRVEPPRHGSQDRSIEFRACFVEALGQVEVQADEHFIAMPEQLRPRLGPARRIGETGDGGDPSAGNQLEDAR